MDLDIEMVCLSDFGTAFVLKTIPQRRCKLKQQV